MRPFRAASSTVATTPADRDAAMMARAATSFAILDVADLASLGIGSSAIHRRVRRGRLFRIHQGVYSVLPPHHLRPEGWWLAAVRAVGPEGFLSWPHSGALWELRRAPGGPVHVGVPSDGGRKKRRGIVVHRRPLIRPEEIDVRRGIRVTSPRRTLLDARAALSAAEFGDLLQEAEAQHLNTGAFREFEKVDRSEIERRLFALCHRHGLPTPRKQQVIGPYTVDFLWAEAGLIVETDGWETHGKRSSFENDRARDARLTTQGYRVVRFTWWQLRDDPATAVATLRSLLASEQ